jgi:thioredoxin reductase (NADPH)
LQDAETKKSEELEVKGLFVYIGHAPASELAKKLGCKIDEHGFIEVNTRLETTVPGVYAAGDVRKGSIGQLIASAADGAIAALSAAEHVHGKPLKGW